jgi:hypothetical protein
MTTRGFPSRQRPRAIAIGSAIILVVSGCTAEALNTSTSTEVASPIAPSASPLPTPTATAEPASPTPTSQPSTAGPLITDVLAVDPPPGFASTITCEGSIGESDSVAIVWLRAADDAEQPTPVLRDYADVTRPRTACIFASGDYSIHSLIDARHVVISGPDQRFAIVDLPEVRYQWFSLPATDASFGSLIAVSPNLDSVIWRRTLSDGSLARQILMTDASAEHLLADLPAIETGRCGSPLDSAEGAFARTGESYYVLDQPFPQMNVFLAGRGADVELTIHPPDAGWDDASTPLMALWSPADETLYYRVGADVMRWSPGSESEVFLPNTRWSHPTFTPNGSRLAYATDEGVYLVDMRRDPAPRLIRADATVPAFLNSSQLWFKVSTGEGCVTDAPQARVYDLNDGAEAPSIIDSVVAVWPATSSSSR